MNITKTELRSIMKKKIKLFDKKEEESRWVMSKLRENEYFKNAEVILSYYPMKSEIDTSSLLSDKRVFLPALEDKNITFRQSDKFIKNKLGFYSPFGGKIAKYESAVILVPLLAFNSSFYRLGRGGGYYDRYLSKNKNKLHSIGLGFSVSFFEDIPLDIWDEKLDEVISTNFYHENQ